MHERAFRRAAAFGAAALLLAVGSAFADSVDGDTDAITAGPQAISDLGTVAPGAVLTENLAFQLVCTGTAHVADGQTVTATFFGATLGAQGAAWPDGTANATDGSIGPVSGWVADGTFCSFPAERFAVGTPSVVTITAPSVPNQPGEHYQVDLLYRTSVAGSNAALTLFAGVAFTFTVASDQPPTLHLPAPMTIEGNTTGGATVTYTATATDPEDSPPPVPTCSPGSGAFFALGTTSVGCTVTDSFGHTVTGSFDVTVVDTTAPTLAGVPGPLSLVTYDPSGIAAAYALPTASDIVDPNPSVSCSPAPGTLVPVGATTVQCTATDASGNSSSASFTISVTLIRLDATFDAPIGPTDQLAINPGRTLPVKATLFRDGVAVTSGAVDLVLNVCGGATIGSPIAVSFQSGRWFLGLDTSGLSGCVHATLRLDGHPAGGFDMNASAANAIKPANGHP